MDATQRHHTLDYVELEVTDLGAAKRFYGQVFGWSFTDYGPGPDYVGIKGAGEREVGGFALADEVTPGGPLLIVYSTDLDASVEAVRAAGGEIVTEPFDFPGGRRFHFRDPSGNRLGVWTETS